MHSWIDVLSAVNDGENVKSSSMMTKFSKNEPFKYEFRRASGVAISASQAARPVSEK